MSQKIALVTGVSRLKGIGRAICQELARQNIAIFFTYWTTYDHQMPWKIAPNEPEIIQQELLQLGVPCACQELDLTKENAIKQLLDAVEQELGATPNILVNNATYSTYTDINSLSFKELDKHYQLNMRATTMLTMAFIKRFSYLKGGRIINLTSGQSLGAMSNEIAYAITKGAIETLTYTIAQTIAAQGITINAVNPGPSDTGWIANKDYEALRQQFPLKRIGQPEDAARLVGFLCSEAAEWITGQIIHSEGGFIR